MMMMFRLLRQLQVIVFYVLIFVAVVDLVNVVDGFVASSSASDASSSSSSSANNDEDIIIDKYLKPYHLELYDFPTFDSSSSNDGSVDDDGADSITSKTYCRGIRTLIDRKPGEIIIQIPLEDTITTISPGAAINSDDDANSNDSSNNNQKQHQQRLLSSLISNNKENFSEEQRLALTLVLMLKRDNTNTNNNNNNSNQSRYVSSILKSTNHYGIWNMPSYLFEGLCLPRCYKEFFQATRNNVLDFIMKTQELQQEVVVAAAAEEENDDDEIMNTSIISNDDIQWGFSMVRSRSLAVPELASENDIELAIIPGLDMFNHDFDASTTLQLVSDDDDGTKRYWTLTSSKSYSKGDQIYLNYGTEKDNWKLLQTYGFASTPTTKNNPNKLIFWTWEDLLDAVSQCRPTMFTPQVCRGLLNHPQLTVYRELSEQRAIFSYDFAENMARDSLNTGLGLMMNLASQLGFPNDDQLPSEVFQKLIDNRYEEIQECRRIRQQKLEIPTEWKPLWDSIQQVLHDEESYLQNAISSDNNMS